MNFETNSPPPRIHHRVLRRGKDHIKKRPYILPVFGLILAVAVVAGVVAARGGETHPSTNSFVVFLYDKGKKQTLTTRSATVGELVDKLPLKLIPQDVVEPSRDTEIVEDNFRINIYRARPVTVVDTDSRKVTLTAQKSPRIVAEKAGLKVYPEDGVRFAAGDINRNIIGEQVVVDRAVPIELNLYGDSLGLRTRSTTVGELLQEKNVHLAAGESVRPAQDTPIKRGLKVFVLRAGAKITTVKQDAPPPTQTVNDPSLSFGTRVVRQEGKPGKKLATYLIETKDGKETRKLIQEVIIEAPVPRIVAVGVTVSIAGNRTSLMNSAGIKSSDHGYVNYIISRESGWNPVVSGLPPGGPYVGAYGLCQANPGSKMASAGSDWLTNPVTQLKWCNGYAVGRYGGWAAAYNFWSTNHHW